MRIVDVPQGMGRGVEEECWDSEDCGCNSGDGEERKRNAGTVRIVHAVQGMVRK